MTWNDSEIRCALLVEGLSLEDADRIMERLHLRAADRLLPLSLAGSRQVECLPPGSGNVPVAISSDCS